jgi:hypothetical protein
MKGWPKGKKHTKETREKMKKTKLDRPVRYWLGRSRPEIAGDKCHTWKGNKAGYRSKHCWIVKYYGQPTTCEHCQTGNLVGHSIHWANISGRLLRERSDWLRLCARCHGLFDKGKRKGKSKHD